jgi:hypothetical protein
MEDSKMKKALCITLAAVLLFSLAACGGGGGGSIDASDPNQGLWNAVKAEMWGIATDLSDLYENGFTIELKSGGKCALNVDGKKANGTWVLNGTAFSIKGGGLDESGTLANGVLTLVNLMGLGMDIIFEKEGGYKGATSPSTSADEPDDSPTSAKEPVDDEKPDPASSGSADANGLSWWEGDWYGYWLVGSADDAYDFLDDGVWDCYAVIDVSSDGSATVYLWDDDTELGTVEIEITPNVGGNMGAASAEGGELFSYAVNHADWLIHPAVNKYDDMIVIQEHFEDDDGDGFYYEIYLRPWGMLWDDIPESERPMNYNNWYMSGYYLMDMLDALEDSTLDGEPVLIHPEVKGRQ